MGLPKHSVAVGWTDTVGIGSKFPTSSRQKGYNFVERGPRITIRANFERGGRLEYHTRFAAKGDNTEDRRLSRDIKSAPAVQV